MTGPAGCRPTWSRSTPTTACSPTTTSSATRWCWWWGASIRPPTSASPVDLRALRNEPWLAAPSGEPSRQATDRLLAAVGLTPPVPSEFEGLGTVANLVARGLGIAIMPRLAVGAYESQVVVRDLPAGLDLSRDVFAVARTASVGRPSVAVIVNALRGAAHVMTRQAAGEAAGPARAG